jgi:hypothetical protein
LSDDFIWILFVIVVFDVIVESVSWATVGFVLKNQMGHNARKSRTSRASRKSNSNEVIQSYGTISTIGHHWATQKVSETKRKHIETRKNNVKDFTVSVTIGTQTATTCTALNGHSNSTN